MAQAFDKVWHEGLFLKLLEIVTKLYADLLESYISDRTFWVKLEDEYSEVREIGPAQTKYTKYKELVAYNNKW